MKHHEDLPMLPEQKLKNALTSYLAAAELARTDAANSVDALSADKLITTLPGWASLTEAASPGFRAWINATIDALDQRIALLTPSPPA
jgi:hypothetical protein